MRINKNFILRQVVDTYVVLPIGQATVDFNGMVTLNESGAFLWRQLSAGNNIAQEGELMNTVKYGDRGEDVLALQKALNAAGYTVED